MEETDGSRSNLIGLLLAVGLTVVTVAVVVVTLRLFDGADTSPSARTTRPATLQDVDPCTLLDPSMLSDNGLKQALVDKSVSSRSCSWTSDAFSAMVLIRWDGNSLIDFAQAFPVLVDSVELDGRRVVRGRSDVRPACAGLLFPGRQGTVVEIVVGDEPPSTAASACERVTALGTVIVQQLRKLNLVSASPS